MQTRHKKIELERRTSFIPSAIPSLEVRSEHAEEIEEVQIFGHAAVFFNENDLEGTQFDVFGDGSVLERIMPVAFDEALSRPDDVRGLVNHDSNLLLGRTTAKTMRLSVDDVGLRFEIDPPDTQVGRDTVTLLNRGDMTGSSFGFLIDEQVFREIEGGDLIIREIVSVTLFDVSPVTFPAFQGTDAQVSDRSLKTLEEFRMELRATPRLNMARRRLKLIELSR